MMLALLLCGSLLASEPIASPAAVDANPTYETAKERAGTDPARLVQLALWCESRGMKAERAEHLARALAADRKSLLAAGLLGLVSFQDRWVRPEAVIEKVRSDADLAKNLAEYNARRDKVPDTAAAQWELALWCERKGLAPEALAHFAHVVRLDPNRASAWKHMGYKSYGGRWMTASEVEAAKAEAKAQRKADAFWEPRLAKLGKSLLGSETQRGEAEQELASITDSRAIPAIWRHLARGNEDQQTEAVQVLNQIDSPTSTRRLAALAVSTNWSLVQSQCVDALGSRDPRDYFNDLIDLLKQPIEVTQRTIPGAPRATELIIENERYIHRRIYVRVGKGPHGSRPVRDELDAIYRQNRSIFTTDLKVAAVLNRLTQANYGMDRASWKAWWADQQGYTYTPTYPKYKKSTTVIIPYIAKCCLGKGTLVHTMEGTRAIEELGVGDRVLAQDTKTGALSFEPIVAVYHNGPAQTLRVTLEDDLIVTTGIHRFWKAGTGWVMARDLKPGDRIRARDGYTRVLDMAKDEQEQPVFNLEVANTKSFFVGQRGVLAHDFSLVDAVTEPFDAVPSLAAICGEAEATPAATAAGSGLSH